MNLNITSMRIAVSAIIIRQGRLLLVRKKRVWILPGGKPESGESDINCLNREIAEELTGAKLRIIRRLDMFQGKTPHVGDMIRVETYLAALEGDAHPSGEIDAVLWTSQPEKHLLSEVTKNIVASLHENHLL